MDTLPKLINHELMELSLPEKVGCEYGYAMFDQLSDIYVNINQLPL